jgi:hypothetical protein
MREKSVKKCDETTKSEVETVRAKDLPFGCSLENPVDLISEEADATHQRGLCSICEGREVCAFPKPEGGVWHCEEYR